MNRIILALAALALFAFARPAAAQCPGGDCGVSQSATYEVLPPGVTTYQTSCDCNCADCSCGAAATTTTTTTYYSNGGERSILRRDGRWFPGRGVLRVASVPFRIVARGVERRHERRQARRADGRIFPLFGRGCAGCR
jgi:hypothetical protein